MSMKQDIIDRDNRISKSIAMAQSTYGFNKFAVTMDKLELLMDRMEREKEQLVNEVTVEKVETGDCLPFLEALATMDITADNVEIVPEKHPHNRDFSIVAEVGAFRFEGELVQEWDIPDMGALRFPKEKLSKVSVLTENGIVGLASNSEVIEACREKLDGVEGVVFGVSTEMKTQYFSWFESSLSPCDCKFSGHYEKVGEEVFFLSGSNELGARDHRWELLNSNFCEQVKEGLIIKISGLEYRVPREKNSTFEVRDGLVRDADGEIWGESELPPAFYDFSFKEGSLGTMLKPRPDKYRADRGSSIRSMLRKSVDLGEFEKWVRMPLVSSASPKIVQDRYKAGHYGRVEDRSLIALRAKVNRSPNVSGRSVVVPKLVRPFRFEGANYGPFVQGELVRIRFRSMDNSCTVFWRGQRWYLVRKIPIEKRIFLELSEEYMAVSFVSIEPRLLGKGYCEKFARSIETMVPPTVLISLLGKRWLKVSSDVVNFGLDLLEVPELCDPRRVAVIFEFLSYSPHIVKRSLEIRVPIPIFKDLMDFIDKVER